MGPILGGIVIFIAACHYTKGMIILGFVGLLTACLENGGSKAVLSCSWVTLPWFEHFWYNATVFSSPSFPSLYTLSPLPTLKKKTP